MKMFCLDFEESPQKLRFYTTFWLENFSDNFLYALPPAQKKIMKRNRRISVRIGENQREVETPGEFCYICQLARAKQSARAKRQFSFLAISVCLNNI